MIVRYNLMDNQIDIYITFNEKSKNIPYGSYDINKLVFEQIKLKLGKSINEYIKNIYYKRNMIIEEINNDYNVYEQNQYNFMILNTSIITMSNIKQLNINDIPILSKYDNQEKIYISEYTKNGYVILLEECNNKYYIHLKLINDKTDISCKISQIEKLFI